MSRHRATETWEQRADRCIRELNGPAEHAGQHRADMVYLDITPDMKALQERINQMAQNFARVTYVRDWAWSE